MSRSKKKSSKVVLISAICGGVGLIAIIVVVLIMMLSKIDYSEAYTLASEIKPALNSVYSNSNCKDAGLYVDSKDVSSDTYKSYLSSCEKAIKASVPTQAVEKLGKTSAVERDTAIKNQFDIFFAAFQNSGLSDSAAISSTLKHYRDWHNFILAENGLSTSTTDASIATVAGILINSGDDGLKTYANEWMVKRIAYARSYTSWQSYASNENYNRFLEAEYDLNKYEEKHKPAIIKAASKDDSKTAVKTEFDKLFNLISDAYKQK